MLRLVVAIAVVAGGLAAAASPATAAGTIVVTPTTGLADGQVVSIAGSGWQPGALIGYCEALPINPVTVNNCASSSPHTTTADMNGDFTVPLTVQRLVTVPGQSVDCAAPSAPCLAAAADASDIGGTAVSQQLRFAAVPPLILPGFNAVPEGNSGTTNLPVPVTLSYAWTQTVTVDWATDPSATCPNGYATATPGTDYTPASGTLTFAPGDTSQTIPISVIGDTIVEPDECVAIVFTNPTNAQIGPNRFGGATAIGVIQNDDTLIPNIGIRRRSDGTEMFGGSNFHFHAITAGGTWTFAVLARNDGNTTGDLVVKALNSVTSPFSIQYFYGYFDVTSTVEGTGLVLPAMAPGETRVFAARFSADPSTPSGASAELNLQATAVTPPGVPQPHSPTLQLQVNAAT